MTLLTATMQVGDVTSDFVRQPTTVEVEVGDGAGAVGLVAVGAVAVGTDCTESQVVWSRYFCMVEIEGPKPSDPLESFASMM